MFSRSLHVTKNSHSFAGSQTLLASENEFNSTGNLNSTETVGDARRLPVSWTADGDGDDDDDDDDVDYHY